MCVFLKNILLTLPVEITFQKYFFNVGLPNYYVYCAIVHSLRLS